MNTLIKIKRFNQIFEKKNLETLLDYPELVEFLLYLAHDKYHVIGEGSTSREMEKIFTLIENKPFNRPLWRGIYPEEVRNFKPGQEFTFNRYSSFSEKFEIARGFAHSGFLLEASSSNGGFNYGEFLIDWYSKLKIEDPREYDEADGDFSIEMATDEAEWIFPKDSLFRVDSVQVEGIYKIIKGKIITANK